MIGDMGGRMRAAMQARGHGNSIDDLLAALQLDAAPQPAQAQSPSQSQSFGTPKISYNLPTLTGSSNPFGPAASPGANPFAFPTFPGSNGDGGDSPATPGPASPLYGTAPESHRSPGYMGDAGYGATVGGSPTGSLGPGYQLNSRQASHLASVIGGLTGVPGMQQAVDAYSRRTGANNPFGPTSGGSFTPGVTVTDNDTNQPAQVQYRGYGSDAYGGGFGDMYYGPSRGADLGDYGENNMNNFGQGQLNYWDTMHRNSNIGSAGMGGYGTGWRGGAPGRGSDALIFAGSASPWDWGGNFSY
jgi:hypothetical protein